MSKHRYPREVRKKWPSVMARYEKRRLLPGEARVSSKLSPWGQMAVRTQEETAKILGCTRQNVHDAERLAIYKIRTALNHIKQTTK